MEPSEHDIAAEMEWAKKLTEKMMVKAGVPPSAVDDDKWWRQARALGDACVRELSEIERRWTR